MKRYLFCVFLLLLMVVPLMGIPYEQTEEYNQKQAILNERAVRFKAETGFEGDITFNHQYMTFSNIIGNFKDIVVTSPQDTVSMRLIFDRVVAKVTPFISAQEGQLIRGKTSSNVNRAGVRYEQVVNGYRIEGAGFLNVAYNCETKKITVTDATVSIPSEQIPINISINQAVQIAIQRYDPNYNYDPGNELSKPRSKLVYFAIPDEIGSHQYRLCYMIAFWGLTVFIDPSSGEIIHTRSLIIEDYHCNVDGEVYESAYSGSYVNSLGYVPIPYVLVATDNFSGWSNSNGYVAVVDSTLNNLDIKLSYQGLLSLHEYPDTLRVKTPDYISAVQDSINARFHDNPCNALNLYFHTLAQFHSLDGLSSFSANTCGMRIIGNMPLSMNNYGEFDPSYNAIRIRCDIGKYSQVSRHELSHAYIFDKLNNSMFHNTDNSKRAMDEAFAVYLPCSAINSSLYINSPYLPNNVNDITNYTVSDVLANFPLEYPGVVPSEDFYQEYFCRYPIASAWWEIRSHLGNTDFDQDLIYALIYDVSTADSLRYKPRYFYNALMRNSTPSNQLVIDKAYSDRGLHFTPQVISAGVSNPLDNKDKNMFRIGDPVHVKVTNCPQNTPLTVYIVEDQDYTDGMSISALNAIICQVTGTSDNDGVWYSSTPVMTASTVGDYDILVDIGNNGMLHFAYNGANIRDGYDGLNGPGFTVYDDGIDVVLALDLSQSMVGECASLQRLTRSFIGAMRPGDKINVFGFNEGNPPNWNGGYSNLSPTPAAQLYSITTTNQSSLISSVGLPSAGGNTIEVFNFLI